MLRADPPPVAEWLTPSVRLQLAPDPLPALRSSPTRSQDRGPSHAPRPRPGRHRLRLRLHVCLPELLWCARVVVLVGVAYARRAGSSHLFTLLVLPSAQSD